MGKQAVYDQNAAERIVTYKGKRRPMAAA